MSDNLRRLAEKAYQDRRAGRRAEAYEGYSQAAAAARTSNDAGQLAHALRHLSDMDREGGRTTEAMRAAQEAVCLYRHIPDESLGLANALRLAAMASSSDATQIWLEARGLYEALRLPVGVADCDDHLARQAAEGARA